MKKKILNYQNALQKSFKDNDNFPICSYKCSSVTKNYLFHVNFKRTSRLTLWTRPRFKFLVLSLEKWTQNESTFHTIVFYHIELGKNTRATSYHTTCSNQLVQMKLSVNEKYIDLPKFKVDSWRFVISHLTGKSNTFRLIISKESNHLLK